MRDFMFNGERYYADSMLVDTDHALENKVTIMNDSGIVAVRQESATTDRIIAWWMEDQMEREQPCGLCHRADGVSDCGDGWMRCNYCGTN